ncbi:hypothetical protein BsWGS_03607 [Bradybaena similaris]
MKVTTSLTACYFVSINMGPALHLNAQHQVRASDSPYSAPGQSMALILLCTWAEQGTLHTLHLGRTGDIPYSAPWQSRRLFILCTWAEQGTRLTLHLGRAGDLPYSCTWADQGTRLILHLGRAGDSQGAKKKEPACVEYLYNKF